MKRLALILCLFTGMASASGSVDAPQPQPDPYRASATLEGENAPRPPQTPGNAAWVYYKAWDTVTGNDDRVAFGTAMGDRPSSGKKLTKEQREQLDKHRAYIDGVLAASAMPMCDFGPRYETGINAMLPYLGMLRGSCRALGVDAVRCVEERNLPGAAERVVGILHISTHAAHDRFLISGLVGIAIGAYACLLTQDMIQQHALTPAAARLIQPVLREIANTPDVYNLRADIDGERQTYLGWLRTQCKGPTAGLAFIRILGNYKILETDSTWPPSHLYLTFDEQKMAAEFDRADRYYDAIHAAWDKPDAAARLAEIGEEAGEGQYGIAAMIVGASFSHCRRSLDRIRTQFAHLDANLTAIIKANSASAPVPYAN